jgi:hypothetical protein
MPNFTEVTFDGWKLSSSGIICNTYEMPTPEPIVYEVDIDGRDGVLDLTEYFGHTRFGTRELILYAYLDEGDIYARTSIRRAIVSQIQGKRKKIVIDTLPEYTFDGRVKKVEYTETGAETEMQIIIECEPYMFLREVTFRANAAGGIVINLPCGDKPVSPKIEVTRESTIAYNGKSWTIQRGTWQIDDFWLQQGNNEVYINSYLMPGSTTWGDLEKMTWGEIGSMRISQLYWLNGQLQERSTWGVFTGKTWEEIRSKTIQEWYYSGEATVTSEVFIQYEWSDL